MQTVADLIVHVAASWMVDWTSMEVKAGSRGVRAVQNLRALDGWGEGAQAVMPM